MNSILKNVKNPNQVNNKPKCIVIIIASKSHFSKSYVVYEFDSVKCEKFYI